MGYELREGYDRNGVPTGKRDFREARENVESLMFRNPKSLVLDSLRVIAAVFYAPFWSLLRHYCARPKSLRGKVCFVTGSGRGIGRGICIALAKKGAVLACADVNDEDNNSTVEIMKEMGATAKAYKLNIAKKEEVDEVARRVEAELGRVYLLVNTAEPAILEAESIEKQAKEVFAKNTLGPIWTIGAFLPKMKEENEGHIVNICPAAGDHGLEYTTAYNSSKAAIKNYSQAVRLELILQGYSNVHVTCVDSSLPSRSSHSILACRDFLQICRVKCVEAEDVVDFTMHSIRHNMQDVSTSAIMDLCNKLAETTPKAQAGDSSD